MTVHKEHSGIYIWKMRVRCGNHSVLLHTRLVRIKSKFRKYFFLFIETLHGFWSYIRLVLPIFRFDSVFRILKRNKECVTINWTESFPLIFRYVQIYHPSHLQHERYNIVKLYVQEKICLHIIALCNAT